MRIVFRRSFKKQLKKLRKGERDRFYKRLSVFMQSRNHPFLKAHPLAGKFKGYKSINIGGDLRAVYFLADRETIIFVNIGTHSELYE